MYSDLLGKEYELGARGPDKFDCWGLMIELYGRHGITLPDQPVPDDLRQLVPMLKGERRMYQVGDAPFCDSPEFSNCIMVLQGAFFHGGYHAGLVLPNLREYISIQAKAKVCVQDIKDCRFIPRHLKGYYRYVG